MGLRARFNSALFERIANANVGLVRNDFSRPHLAPSSQSINSTYWRRKWRKNAFNVTADGAALAVHICMSSLPLPSVSLLQRCDDTHEHVIIIGKFLFPRRENFHCSMYARHARVCERERNQNAAGELSQLRGWACRSDSRYGSVWAVTNDWKPELEAWKPRIAVCCARANKGWQVDDLPMTTNAH